MSEIRAFVSVDIPENIKEEIIKIQKILPEFKGRLTEPQNLHLTLKFLGYVEPKKIELVKEKLKYIKIKPFDSEIKDIGTFTNTIIWLHLTDIDELQKSVDDSLSEMFEKERRFMSHLTIARVKNVRNKKRFLEELQEIKFPTRLSFKVDKFQLKKSTLTPKGPVYENLEEYSLV